MSESIGEVLPFAVGIAISPLAIIGLVLILFSDRARINGMVFAVGWVVALVATAVIVLVVSRSFDIRSSGSSSGRAWLHIGLGVLFLLLAARQIRRIESDDASSEGLPKWMLRIEDTKPLAALALGFALAALNPKNLILAIGASVQVAHASLTTAADIVSIAVFIVVSSVTIFIPVVWVLVGRDSASHVLGVVKSWFVEHNNAVMIVLFLVLGVLFVGKGISAFG